MDEPIITAAFILSMGYILGNTVRGFSIPHKADKLLKRLEDYLETITKNAKK